MTSRNSTKPHGWTLKKVFHNPMQNYIVVEHSDPAATPTTDYHKADALARKVLGEASLSTKTYGFDSELAQRYYVSQCY